MKKVLGRKVALEGEEDRGDRFDGIVPCERGDSLSVRFPDLLSSARFSDLDQSLAC